MKKIIYLIIAVLVVGGVIVIINIGALAPTKTSTIDSNTTLEGNQTIGKNEKIVVKNSALLTINGDLEIRGALKCEGGALNLAVNGNLVVDKNITCNRTEEDIKSGDPGTAISIVVTGSAIFGEDAVVTSNSHVQIADSAEKIAKTAAQLERIFDGVETDTGTKPRIGPLVLENKNTAGKVQAAKGVAVFAPVAHAQAPEPCVDNNGNIVPNCVRIGGKWVIGEGEAPPTSQGVPTPPKGVRKIVLNFDFGPSHDFRIEDFALSGPDGRPGENDLNRSCTARGGNGEDAFRVRVAAGNITINNFELWLGDGGRGGNAETIKNCDPGRATGGNGGKPGNLKIEASRALDIVGSFIIHPGYGGDAGRAIAHGRDGANGCPAQKGGDATARGGNGADNKKDLRALGSITGLNNVSVSPTRGGHGGEGIADPGKGGNGTGCGCRGGDGGKGTAIGGKGGNANLVVLSAEVKTNGGNGGDADSHGGLGGNGGMCNADGPGGNGGNGGDASSAKGLHGTGKTNGDDGRILNETGGNGGNGGDGCPEGQGGKGGRGNPNGKDGKLGKNLCKIGTTPLPETEIIQMQLESTQPPTSEPIREEPRPETEFPQPPQEETPSFFQ